MKLYITATLEVDMKQICRLKLEAAEKEKEVGHPVFMTDHLAMHSIVSKLMDSESWFKAGVELKELRTHDSEIGCEPDHS